MKKNWTKHLWQALGALALTLPLAAALTAHQPVQAAEGDTQHVILTKYGFDTNQAAGDHNTNQTPEEAQADWAKDATPLEGVKFEVYDVTSTYWSDPSSYQKQEDGSIPLPDIKTGTKVTADTGSTTDTTKKKDSFITDANGQIKLDLPTISGDHNAVYVFHEVTSRTGYKADQDFMLSLPADHDSEGNVYVYPKNTVATTHYHKFLKQDAVTLNPLAGAVFTISNSNKETLSLEKADGTLVAEVSGYVNTEEKNYKLVWGTNKTTFTSDKDGVFGLNGSDDAATDFIATEIKAPAGYEVAPDPKTFKFDDKADDKTNGAINDQPTGLLPHTGGAGIIGILAIGAVLIVLTVIGIRKRQARA